MRPNRLQIVTGNTDSALADFSYQARKEGALVVDCLGIAKITMPLQAVLAALDPNISSRGIGALYIWSILPRRWPDLHIVFENGDAMLANSHTELERLLASEHATRVSIVVSNPTLVPKGSSIPVVALDPLSLQEQCRHIAGIDPRLESVAEDLILQQGFQRAIIHARHGTEDPLRTAEEPGEQRFKVHVSDAHREVLSILREEPASKATLKKRLAKLRGPDGKKTGETWLWMHLRDLAHAGLAWSCSSSTNASRPSSVLWCITPEGKLALEPVAVEAS